MVAGTDPLLSVRDGEAEKIEALDAGADDYVTKPFATGELMARLRAPAEEARRQDQAGSAEFNVGGMRINFRQSCRACGRSGGEVLTRKQFDLLAILARTPAGWSRTAIC